MVHFANDKTCVLLATDVLHFITLGNDFRI